MKKGPIILIAFLVAFAVFILGMQYGKRVETADKAIELIMKITPPPQNVTIIPHEYIQVIHKKCGISYIMPDYAQDSEDYITVTCGDKIASDSAQLDKNKYAQLMLDNPNNNMQISLIIRKEFLPLIKRSVSFLQ